MYILSGRAYRVSYLFFFRKFHIPNLENTIWFLTILLSIFSVSMVDLQWGHISTVIGSPLKFCTNMHLMYQKTQTSSSDTCSRSELRTYISFFLFSYKLTPSVTFVGKSLLCLKVKTLQWAMKDIFIRLENYMFR